MLKVFCKEQLEKQTVVHGMETAHEDACSVRAGGSLGARWERTRALLGACQGLAGSPPGAHQPWERLASSSGNRHRGGWSGMGRPGSSPGQGGCVVSSALEHQLACLQMQWLFNWPRTYWKLHSFPTSKVSVVSISMSETTEDGKVYTLIARKRREKPDFKCTQLRWD